MIEDIIRQALIELELKLPHNFFATVIAHSYGETGEIVSISTAVRKDMIVILQEVIKQERPSG